MDALKTSEEISSQVGWSEAAGLAVARHLAKLHALAKRAQQDADVETVHQLRVYSRRIQTILSVLSGAFPSKHSRRLAKRARQIRQVAGQIRDGDVFEQAIRGLGDHASADERIGIDYLLEKSPRRRKRGEVKLIRRLAKLDRTGFWSWVRKHYPSDMPAASLTPAGEGESSILDHGRAVLDEEFARFREMVTRDPEGDIERIHELRLGVKRFRYILEVLADCVASKDRRRLLEPIKRLQDVLGGMNDSCQFAHRLDREARQSEDADLARSLYLLRDRFSRTLAEQIQSGRLTWSEDEVEEYRLQVFQLTRPIPT